MAFIPVPNAVLARWNFTLGTQSFSVNPWFSKAGFTFADQTDLANALDGIVVAELKPFMSSSASYVNVTAYDMRSETAPIVVNSDGAGPGSGDAFNMPINCACVLTLYSATRGRSGRGRLYFAGFNEGDIDNGTWSVGLETALEDLGTQMKAAVEAIGWTWVVASRYTAGAARTEGVTYAITNWAVRSRSVGTQRRRVDRP